jgi:hypothetical protein
MAGRSFEEVVRNGINRNLFFEEQRRKAPKRRPRRVGKKPRAGTLFAIRNKRMAIREAALRDPPNQIIITYTKTTTGETKKYLVAPYEFKYRRLRIGRRKMLWAVDMEDRQKGRRGRTKSFALRNIKNVVITDRKFRPRYPIKIK